MDQFPTAIVTFSGTYSGANMAFEGSLDNVTWFLISAAETHDPKAGNSYALTDNSTVAFQANVAGFKWFRVRAAAFTSGSLKTTVVPSSSVAPPSFVQAIALSGFTGTDGISGNAALWQLSNQAGRILGVQGYGFNGSTLDRLRTATVFKPIATTAITAGTGATIWTPAVGKKFRLMGWLLSLSVAGQLIFGDNLVGTVIARSEQLAAAGVSKVGPELGNGILSAAANNVLKLDVSASGSVAGMVWGTEE